MAAAAAPATCSPRATANKKQATAQALRWAACMLGTACAGTVPTAVDAPAAAEAAGALAADEAVVALMAAGEGGLADSRSNTATRRCS